MTETNQVQVVQIQKQIELLKTQKGKSPFLTISEVGSDAIVQLARISSGSKTNWSLNIAYYPSTEKPAKALAAVGMSLPANWQEEQFDSGTMAQFSVPESDLPKLPQFIHDLYVKFFKRPPTYKIECALDDM